MDSLTQLNQDTFGKSWGDTLREAAATVEDQPIEESETVAEPVETEEQEETVVTEDDGAQVDEDHPEAESETEAPAYNDDTEVEMGDDRKPVKLSELKAGYQRQSDYTKKTQELASQRRELESQMETLKPAQEWLSYMNSNPWVFNQIDAALKEFHASGVLPIQEALQDAQYGQYINHLMAENSRLSKELEGVKGEYEGVKINSSMTSLRNELKEEYGDLVTDEYMSTLQDRAKNERISTETLKEIAEGHLAKQKLKAQPTTKQAEAKAFQRIQEVRKTAPVAPKPAATQSAPPPAPTNESWADMFRRLAGK